MKAINAIEAAIGLYKYLEEEDTKRAADMSLALEMRIYYDTEAKNSREIIDALNDEIKEIAARSFLDGVSQKRYQMNEALNALLEEEKNILGRLFDKLEIVEKQEA